MGSDDLTRAELAACIDHSVLGPAATPSDVRLACSQAMGEGFAALCVNSAHAPLALAELKPSQIPVAVTIGFPLGACSSSSKKFEAREALELGARELDVVMALGALRAGQDQIVQDELGSMAQQCAQHGALLKVILETCLLESDELLRAIDLACAAGADFVKTSTGFGSAGASIELVSILRQRAPAHVGVKAAGGIRTLKDAKALLKAGASRLGCSASMAILAELGT